LILVRLRNSQCKICRIINKDICEQNKKDKDDFHIPSFSFKYVTSENKKNIATKKYIDY